jgi:type 1 fimbriae regulatory protein FimB
MSNTPVEHPIAGDELRAIKRYSATRPDALPWLFISNADSRSRGRA